jgi:hypothetical protein
VRGTRPGQKSYVLPDGTVITVDAAIPDAVLDRLNRLPPGLVCESTCSGGHRPWLRVDGVERPAPKLPKPRGPREALSAVLVDRRAKAGFRFTEPGTWRFRAFDGTRHRLYVEGANIWIVAAHSETVAPPEWWDGLCAIVEGATRQ